MGTKTSDWDASTATHGGVAEPPKWVCRVHRSQSTPTPRLSQNAVGRCWRAELEPVGEIDVAGPDLALAMTDLG